MHTIKRLKNKTLSALIAMIVALALLFGSVCVLSVSARADEVEDTVEYAPTSLDLSNGHFSNSSGNYPATPTSWTGGYVGNSKGNVKSGVVDLSASGYTDANSGNKKFELDQYPEYEDEGNKPVTVFGANTEHTGSDEKALLINTAPGASTAYAYKSSDMSFAPNSFYRVSVWTKTGDFASRTGATIKLSGLGQSCSFLNINTVKDIQKDAKGIPQLTAANNYGWVNYTFYVRTSASLTKTVQLVLGIGDAVTGDSEDPDIMPAPAHGYAFFDTVEAERISAHDFATETSTLTKASGKDNVYTNTAGTVLALNLNEAKSMTVTDATTGDELEIGTFSQNEEQWELNAYYDENATNFEPTGTAHAFIYNSERRIDDLENNSFGFTKNPWAPFGKAEYYSKHNAEMFAGTNVANIMLISTFDGKEFTSAAYGIASPTVKIEKYKYYRFSVWVKGDSIEDGSGITVLIKGKPTGAAKKATLSEYTNLDGDASDTAHYGWREQVFYLRGSMLYDYDVNFELWLGTPLSLSKGIAMFDNVTFTELSYTDYSEMSAADSGNVYSFDNNDDNTGVSNGNFNMVGDIEELTFPMPAAEWTYYTTDTVTVRGGYSSEPVATDKAVHGILPIDQTTFPEIAASGKIPGVVRPSLNDVNSVLLLSSYNEQTAFCYQSPSITLSVDTAYKLTVDMSVDNIKGYGASLVLKTTDGSVLSTIENITNTGNGFKTFTFYLNAPSAEQTVHLEIWLGLNDRKSNTSKLSSGNVYVKTVAINSWTAAENSTVDAEFAEVLKNYKAAVADPALLSVLDYGVYSFSAPTLDYYDAYTYMAAGEESNLGYAYRWSRTTADGNKVISGMFNSDYMKDLTVYEGFDRKDLTGNMLYIFNTAENHTKYSTDSTVSLVANKYYRIDVSLKVRLSSEDIKNKTKIGATLELTGSSAKFADIKDTSTLKDPNNEASRDYETFKTYSFYVSTGDNGGSIGIAVSLGGDTRDEYISGKLVLGGIKMTEIDNLDYEEAQSAKAANTVTVELSETVDDDDNSDNVAAPESSMQWWILPTVIFGAALIAAIAIIVVMRVRDKVKSKRKVKYDSPVRDRETTLREIEKLQAQLDSDNEQQVDTDGTRTIEDYEVQDEPTEQTPAETEEQSTESPAEPEQPAPAKPNADDLDD